MHMVTMSRLASIFLLFYSYTLAAHDESVRIPSKCPLIAPKSIRTSPIVIAHRGASFSLPEHSLPAYRLALELGADYIEPDLVGTKDGHLVICHSINLNITTNVARVFPNRFSTREDDSTGYYAYDFTLAEIQQLSVQQRMPQARSTAFDGMFGVPSLQDALKLLHEWNHDILPLLTPKAKLLPQQAGLYAELKDPEIYQKMTNQSMVDVFLQELQTFSQAHEMDSCKSLKFNEYRVPPLVVQSFDAKALQQVHEKWNWNTTTAPPLVLLAHDYECLQEDFWFHVGESRDYIQGIGVDKSCLAQNYRDFMDKAEEYELAVHAWVERRELSELGEGFDDIQQELHHLYCDVGVHGVFSENVADAVLVAQVGCDTNTTQDEPTVAPTTDASGNTPNDANNSAGASTSNPNSLCYESVDEQAMYIGFAAGVMGIFIGSIVTLCISNSRCCKRRRQRRHRMVVPHHDDGEMI